MMDARAVLPRVKVCEIDPKEGVSIKSNTKNIAKIGNKLLTYSLWLKAIHSKLPYLFS